MSKQTKYELFLTPKGTVAKIVSVVTFEMLMTSYKKQNDSSFLQGLPERLGRSLSHFPENARKVLLWKNSHSSTGKLRI